MSKDSQSLKLNQVWISDQITSTKNPTNVIFLVHKPFGFQPIHTSSNKYNKLTWGQEGFFWSLISLNYKNS